MTHNLGQTHTLTINVHTMRPDLTTEQICRRIWEAIEHLDYTNVGFMPEHPIPESLLTEVLP